MNIIALHFQFYVCAHFIHNYDMKFSGDSHPDMKVQAYFE